LSVAKGLGEEEHGRERGAQVVRDLDDHLQPIGARELVRETLRGVAVDLRLHPLQGTEQVNDLGGIAYLARGRDVVEKRLSKAFDHLPARGGRRQLTQVRREPNGRLADRLAEESHPRAELVGGGSILVQVPRLANALRRAFEGRGKARPNPTRGELVELARDSRQGVVAPDHLSAWTCGHTDDREISGE
jgi:hypothetical protein